MIVSDEQLQKEKQEFRHSPHSFYPANQNWNIVLRLMHNIEKLPYDGTIPLLKKRLEQEIQTAYKNQDIEHLKQIFPTREDLVAHGSALWIMTHTPINNETQKTPIEFMQEIFQSYNLDNHPEVKNTLLLQRGPNGKYAADFSHIYQYTSPQTRASFERAKGYAPFEQEDTRTPREIEEVRLYKFLKAQIKEAEPEPTKEEIHQIGDRYEDNRPEENRQASGTPISAGFYIEDKNGQPIAYLADTIQETYPEIRLRNIGDETKKEQSCNIRELNPNSNKSLVEQVIENTDFPEDFSHHFNALSIWEKDYQDARQDGQRFAYIRYFIQNRGAFIFEDKEDKNIRTNSKDGQGTYSGYAGISITNSGERYPHIVCRSDYLTNKPDKTFFHELYHRIDLDNGSVLSQQALTQYAFMLCAMDNDNPLKTPFNGVTSAYPPSEFEKEVLARIMSYTTDEHFQENHLLTEYYKIGKLFALAKADKIPAIEHRIQHALYDMPELSELQSMYADFMHDKKETYEEEAKIRSKYPSKDKLTEEQKKELHQKLQEHEERAKARNTKNNQENEARRVKLESALLKRMKMLNHDLNMIYNNQEQVGDIILPPHIINKYNTIRKDKTSACAEFYVSKFMPKEVSHETLNIQIRHLERDILSNNSPEIKFLRLYAIVHTLNNLGYDELVGVPNIDNLPKQFDDLQSSPDKWDNLINKLGLFSEELANGSDKTDIQLACLFNKPVKELTDDDRLIGYLSKNIYHTNTDEQQKAEFYAPKFMPKEVSHETLNIQIRHLERDILSNNSPEIKFLRLYAIVHILNNLGYDNLVGVPNIDNLSKQFDDLQSSPDKWDNLINKLSLFSEELANGSDKTDIQLACLFNKPVKELTDDDRLIGYLSKNIYHTNTGEQQKFAQMFIQKLEENGYDPQKISDIIFNNVEYDDNGNEIIQDISFPKNKIKAGKILRHLDKNYDIETLRLISIKGEKYFEQYTPQYRQPYFLAGSDHIPIMFYSEYEAKKYIQEQENKQQKQTDNLKETQTTTQSNRLSKILSQNSEQTIPSSNITQNNNNCVTPPIVPSQQTRGILNTNLRDELSILTERPEAPKTPQQNISSPSHNKGR